MSYEKQTWVNNVSDVDEEKMNNIEDGIYGNSVDIENFKNTMLYRTGETLNIPYIIASGMITSGSTFISLPIYTPKRLDNINSITLNTLKMEARGIKGYLNNQAGTVDFLTDSNYTVSVFKRTNNLLTISIYKETAFTNVDNNTPVVFTGEVSVTFN